MTITHSQDLDNEIVDLEAKIRKIKEQELLKGKCSQFDAKTEKMEKKRKKLEKYMELEMSKMIAEEGEISEDMGRLQTLLQANIEASENLVRTEACAGAEGRGKSESVSNSTNRMLEFLSKTIKEKEADLECPICLETAEVPIFMCQEQHLICSICRPKVKECPVCRVALKGPSRRHRYAEKTAEELKKLKEEFSIETATSY